MNNFKRKILNRLLLIVFIIGLLDLCKSPKFFGRLNFLSEEAILYYLLHLPLLIIFYLKFKKNLFLNFINKWREIKIPEKVKHFVLVVYFFNLLSIFFSFPIYPFYDVGMFSKNYKFNEPSVKTKTQYYYIDKNKKPTFIDLRNPGFLLLNSSIDFRATHVYTFSINYHNRSKKSTFNEISEYYKQRGIDTLFVGLRSIDYKSKEVLIETDPSRVREFILKNSEGYGNSYIPEYQK